MEFFVPSASFLMASVVFSQIRPVVLHVPIQLPIRFPFPHALLAYFRPSITLRLRYIPTTISSDKGTAVHQLGSAPCQPLSLPSRLLAIL